MVSCEHNDLYDSPVQLSGLFEVREEADAHVKNFEADSLAEFLKEYAGEDGHVQTLAENGHPTCGCVLSIVDLAHNKWSDDLLRYTF